MHWPDHLPTLLQMYNNTIHETTGLTPHFVMFGRYARLPVETAVGAPPLTQRHSLGGWVHQHNQTFQKVYRQVAAKTRETRMRYKERYDKRAKHLPLLDNGYCYATFSVESKASWHLIDSLNSTLSSGNYILACQFSKSSQKDRKALLGQSIKTISDLVLLTPQMCHKSHIQTQTLRQLN